MKEQYITLSQGSGGVESNALIEEVIYKILGEIIVDGGEDAGVCDLKGKIALSTDSYVVSPIFFPGGDIGKLCVCGSSNDITMRGAKPRYISLGLILEEGMKKAQLEQILHSIKSEAQKTNLKILSGDTKVVPKGVADRIYINTTAIGELYADWRVRNIQEGDEIIVSAPIGAHGAVIFCTRNEVALQSDLQSDCAQLYPMIESVRDCHIHTMRDATRGGLAAVLNEWSRAASVEIILTEESIPVLQQVRGVCEILGLEALSLANEGVCVMAVPPNESKKVLSLLKSHPLGTHACVIGHISRKVQDINQARVILCNAWGGKRYVEYPQGELLPRIC
ncbi:hydrogenase expression/formation protein HypE [Helicobacter hepaticus]|jgi:hydrogenase expression/formation protein HypE|uniref:Hydrogenase isoenzymes formation protein n=1 Tax=Helicobacter hepaticus (strain ATCC 51449 / 3B1) TaxID=235279 RepID=Q7VJC3_HELHP|nr:hydrogenase expression/formation protein HypE [Helicobacter hepaticus]AAP76917.1 hydrogenase isoenzymes formation protein [Helicobacter hepaticus ATCC 51449]